MNIKSKLKNHLKFIDTITTKLLTLVLFISVIPLMVVANFSTGIINQSMLDSEKNELNLSVLLTKQKYQEELNTLKILVTQAVKGYINDSYLESIKTGNQGSINDAISALRKNSDLDFCLIIDKNSVGSTPNTYINESLKNIINEAFEGKSIASTEFISGNSFGARYKKDILLSKNLDLIGLSQVTAVPIHENNNKVKAVFLVGKSLTGNSDLPYLIKIMTGASLSIFRIDGDNSQIITTNMGYLADNSKKNHTDKNFLEYIKAGQAYSTKVSQSNGTEVVQYEPIKNYIGNVIGAIYIGIPEVRYTEPGNNNIKLISLISVISLIVSIIIAALFARTITTPILKLVVAAKSIATGYLHQRVKMKGNDEIAQLSQTFNKMADNLQKQEQLKDNFVATLTHDLKVPMLAENQTINYLLKEAYGPITEEQKEVLELIRSTNNSSLEMVGTLLEVYRYDTGNAQLLKSQFDVVKLVRESIDQIKSLAQDKKINISLETNQEQVYINADEREIKRVLHNLISNAIINGIHRGQILCNVEYIGDTKLVYSPKSGVNEYTTLSKALQISNSVIISVKDDGVGINRDDIPELFNRFSLNKGRKPAGTGLGLYYSFQVVNKHQGYIWAESTEGEGSTFKFTLPLEG